MTGGDKGALVLLFTVILPYFLFLVLFSHISFFLLALSSAYCYVSKNMACLNYNISSEKRLIIGSGEKVCIGAEQ